MGDYRCVTTLKEIEDYIGGAKIIAFDFETSPIAEYRNERNAALDAHRAAITGISLSTAEGSAIYIPLKHRAGDNANGEEIMEWLKEAVFMNTGVIKVAHNLSFEGMFLYALGIAVQPPCYDTIAASQLTLKSSTEFRELKDSGLKTLVPELFNVEMPGFEEVTGGRHFDEFNPLDPAILNYACADSDYTLRLYHLFNCWFDNYLPGHRYICEELESPTAVYVGMMKYNGLLVDKSLMLSKGRAADERLMKIREEISFIAGDVDIGANCATAAFKNYLYRDLGLPVLKTTEKNREAADDEALLLLKEWCRLEMPELLGLFDLVQEYRKWGKIKSTYIDGYIEYINSATGRIHPELFPLGTETGRFASRKPNLQNCPRRDNDPVGVRSFIIAPPGMVLLSLDLSQIELRVGAYFSRDDRMLKIYREGGDIHAGTTSVIYKIPLEEALDKSAEHYKERRSIAKNCNFGVFFGLYPRGLQRNLKFKAGLDTSYEECEEIIRNLKEGYPGLSRWQEEVKRKARLRGFSETALGRRRYLSGINSPDFSKRSFGERCALNTPIQGTAADILKLALSRMLPGLKDRPWLRPLLQIHDELIFELPEDRVEEGAAFVKAIMEETPFGGFDIPIVAEGTAGLNFGDMKELEMKP